LILQVVFFINNETAQGHNGAGAH